MFFVNPRHARACSLAYNQLCLFIIISYGVMSCDSRVNCCTCSTSLFTHVASAVNSPHHKFMCIKDSQNQQPARQILTIMPLLKLPWSSKTIVHHSAIVYLAWIAFLQALPEHGKLVACDRDPRALHLAQHAFAKAGIAHKVSMNPMAVCHLPCRRSLCLSHRQ